MALAYLLVVFFFLMDWGIYAEAVKPVFSLADIVLVAISSVTLFHMLLLKRFSASSFVATVLVFVFLGVGAIGVEDNLLGYLKSAGRLSFYGITVFLSTIYFSNIVKHRPGNRKKLILVIVACGSTTALLSVMQYSIFALTGHFIEMNPFLDQRYFAEGFGFRSPGVTGEPSYNGYLLSISLILLHFGGLEFTRQSRLILSMLMTMGLLTTLSLGTFICISIVIVYAVIINRTSQSSRQRVWPTTIGLWAAIGVAIIVTGYVGYLRFGSEDVSLGSLFIGDFRYTSSISTRMVAFYSAFVILMQQPWFGVGIGQTEAVAHLIGLESYNYTGSGLIGVVFVFTGVLGFLVFTSLLYFLRFRILSDSDLAGRIGFFLLVVFFLINMSSVFSSDLWAFVVILIALRWSGGSCTASRFPQASYVK